MKTNAVSERGKIKDRFLALDVNIPQEEAKNQQNKLGATDTNES